MFMLVAWLDELQVGEASLGRLIGVGPMDADEKTGDVVDSGEGAAVDAAKVRYAYTEGHDVLHDVDLVIPRGERLAIVGPSGAGKSTLGRLIAGIDSHVAAASPSTGAASTRSRCNSSAGRSCW